MSEIWTETGERAVRASEAAEMLGMSPKTFHAYWPEHALLRDAAFVPPGKKQRRFIARLVLQHREQGK